MDDETRRTVDEACLRLLGHEGLRWSERDGGWWLAPTFDDQVRFPQSPSRQPAFVVPLAEELRARGWSVYIEADRRMREDARLPRIRVHLWRTEPERQDVRVEAYELAEALAAAAARAVGTEQELPG